MEDKLVDFSVLEDLSGGDHQYKYELLGIFITSVDEGMANLEHLVKNTDDLDAIFKQAHALKSPAGIVRVWEMLPRMMRIEELGRKGEGMQEINELFDRAKATYTEARPVLVAEREKNKPAE